jgi:pyruvate dehydrogenase E2 component (dihydrolipoamide acetyltransferase)
MPIEIKMPALSPTMEEGTLAKWLVKEGDRVKSGDLLAEIETDKATMEFEAVDEGVIASIMVAEGADNVKVGTVIATMNGDDEAAPAPKAAAPKAEAAPVEAPKAAPATAAPAVAPAPAAAAAPTSSGDRVKASPLARRIAAEKSIDLAALSGSGPNGRIVRADLEGASKTSPATVPGAGVAATPAPAAAPKPATVPDIPHEATKLSNVRKTIARRLTESKQQVPHIYLTVDIRLDALLRLRADLNKALEARGVKLSVNDLIIKALAASLIQVPKCNVMFTPDQLISFSRADISVAVSTPNGLITPIIADAANKGLAAISTEMKDLAGGARAGQHKPEDYSLSNMGMYGIKQFEAVINPPQGMIMAIGAGEKRPYVIDDALGIATIMSATGSFDHRAIDGADGAELMQAFKALIENPLGMLA